MMADVQINITNLPEIKAAFGKSPVLMREELNLAIRKSILSIQKQSMINTPVATGRLRSSTSSLFSDLRGEVGTHTNYDIYVHDGTKYMPGRPYLRDAVETTSGATVVLFREAVQNVLNKIGRSV